MAGQTPINAEGMYVSGSYFPVLGVRAAAGRLFTQNDDVTLGGHYIAVLNYAYWETQLGSNPNVLNQQITELQSAVSQQSAHIKELAAQLENTITALEKAGQLAEARLRRVLIFTAVSAALAVAALGVAFVAVITR